MEDILVTDVVADTPQPRRVKPCWEPPVLDVLDVRETLNGGIDIMDGGITSLPMS